MLKDITFGQYYDSNSFVHKLDPRAKLLLLIVIIILIFITKNAIALGFVVLFIIISVLFSKVSIKMYLKNLKAILPVLIFTFIINLFYNTSGEVILSIFKISITTGSLYRALFMSARIILLIISSAELTYTTTPNDLTDAIEKMLSPLKIFKLQNAVHTIAMMMTIALRFIPTLIEETQKIMSAQKARGADLENGKLIDRIKALIPILIPLLVSSVRRAYELADAMECRCYNGGIGRVRMKQLKFSKKDYTSFIFAILFVFFVIISNIIF